MEQISALSTNKPNNSYKISFRKIARAAAAEVRVNRKLAIISFVLYGVAMMLFMSNANIYPSNHGFPPAEFEPSGWGVFFAVLGVIVGYFSALNVFRDMNSQQLCDVSMALPIKAIERFFSKLLALFYIQIVPLIVSTLGGNGIAIMTGLIRYGSMESGTVQRMFMIVFCGLAASMFIMSIVVLCACCCGTFAESSYFSTIMMFIINALPLCFIHNIINRCAGFFDYNVFSNESVDLGYWGFLFFVTENEDGIIPHCAVGIAISLAVMLLSGLIYKKRDARSVGTPISSRVFFEVMMALSCVTIFSFFAMSTAAPWGVLIAGVAYIIISIIVCRAKINALSFLKWAGKYLATAAVFTGILIAAIKTGGFGYINARPAAKYLEGASFTVIYFNNSYTYNYYSDRVALYTQPLTAEQADRVMTICKKHIAKGRAKINVFDVMFGNENESPSTATVRVGASGSAELDFRPSPKSQFEKRSIYDHESDTRVTWYMLNHDQYIIITIDEAWAMAAELKELDFVYDEQEWEAIYENEQERADIPETQRPEDEDY